MRQFLESKGYTLWGTKDEPIRGYKFIEHSYQKRVDILPRYHLVPLCQLNDKLHINVVTVTTDVTGTYSTTVTINICAEDINSDWVSLKVYGIDEEKFIDNIGKYEDKVVAMWTKLNEEI